MSKVNLMVGREDLERLDTLLECRFDRRADKIREFLLGELVRATILDDRELPSTVVAMHSTVEFRDDDSGRVMTATLVYPHETGSFVHAVSIMTPVGAALIGLSEGQSIAFETPDGRSKSLTVLRVLGRGAPANSAPEAARLSSGPDVTMRP